MFSKKFCKKCWINFNDSENYVTCFGPCNSLYHTKCAQIKDTKLEKDQRKLDKIIWYCEICKRLNKLQVFLKVIIVCDSEKYAIMAGCEKEHKNHPK